MSNTPGVSLGTPHIGWWQSFKNKLTLRRERRISQQNASASKDIRDTCHVSQRKIKWNIFKATWNDFRKGNIKFGDIKKVRHERLDAYVETANWCMLALEDLSHLKKAVTVEGEKIKEKEDELYQDVKVLEEKHANVYKWYKERQNEYLGPKQSEIEVHFSFRDTGKETPETIQFGSNTKDVIWRGSIGEKYQALKDANKNLAEKKELLKAAYRGENEDAEKAEVAYDKARAEQKEAQSAFEPYREQFEVKKEEYMALLREYGQAETEIWSAKKAFRAAARQPEDYPTQARWNFLSSLRDKFEAAKTMLSNSKSEAETKIILGVMQQMIKDTQSMEEEMVLEDCDILTSKPKSCLGILGSELKEIRGEMECCIQDIKECGISILKEPKAQFREMGKALREMESLQKDMQKTCLEWKECSNEDKRKLIDLYVNVYIEFTKAFCSLGKAENPQNALSELRKAHNALTRFDSQLMGSFDLETVFIRLPAAVRTFGSQSFGENMYGESFRKIIAEYGEEYKEFLESDVPMLKDHMEVEFYLNAVKGKEFDPGACSKILEKVKNNREALLKVKEKCNSLDQFINKVNQAIPPDRADVEYTFDSLNTCLCGVLEVPAVSNDQASGRYADSAAFLGELSKRTKMPPEDLIGKLAQHEKKEPKEFVEGLAKEMGSDVNVFIKTLAKNSGVNMDDLKAKLGFTTEPAVS